MHGCLLKMAVSLRSAPWPHFPKNSEQADEVIDAKGGYVLPGWCDPHTHAVFAAPREEEFVDKIKGRTYQEIAAKGGGILNSAKKLRSMDDDVFSNRPKHACKR